jgi:hypothetical protein
MLINHFKTAWGITLWRWGKFQIELWYCPTDCVIEPHTHDKQDIKLTFLFGRKVFHRQYKNQPIESIDTKHVKFGHTFNIPAGTLHWFDKLDKPLIFFSREWWTEKPTSAAIDYNPR